MCLPFLVLAVSDNSGWYKLLIGSYENVLFLRTAWNSTHFLEYPNLKYLLVKWGSRWSFCLISALMPSGRRGPLYKFDWVWTYLLNEDQMKGYAAMIPLFVDQLILQLIYRRKNLKKNPNESDMILKVAVGVTGKVLFEAKVHFSKRNHAETWTDLLTLIQTARLNHFFVELFEVELLDNLDFRCALELCFCFVGKYK